MLVLTRKPGEKIVLNNGITLTVTQCRNGRVRLGIEAPPEVQVLRGELAETFLSASPTGVKPYLARWREKAQGAAPATA